MSRRPRICIVVTSHITAVAFLGGYLSFLRAQGWDVALVCSPGPGLTEFARSERVALHCVPMERDPALVRDAVSLLRMTVLMFRLRPDIVVFATPKASLLTAIAAAISHVRVRVHELWGLRLETTGGIRFAGLWVLEKLTSILSTMTIANSRSLAQRAVALGLEGAHPPVVLGAGSSHGVDLTSFDRDADMPDLDRATQLFLDETAGLTVGFVGRIHPDKGVDTLLDALEICSSNDVAVRALLVGADEGGLSTDTSRHRDGALAHRVGAVDDPRPYYAVLDVLVLMSLREGFPNVVLEAASMSVPAIVAGCTGSIDAVIDEVTGVVLPAGDAIALADTIRRLADNRDRLLKLGRAARGRVESEFSRERIWRLHSDCFGALLTEDQDRSMGRAP